jgi:hypothetical protein
VGVIVAIVAALVSVMALLALRPSLLPARGRSAQIYIFSDDQHSESTTLLLNVVEALPLFQGYDDQRMTCDGVAFSYGAPPWQSLLGYYGNVHTRPTGQSYHCVFRDWQGEAALEIPAIAAPSNARFVTPVAYAQLSRNEPIKVALAFAPGAPSDGAPFMTLQARDAQAHYCWNDSYGAGGYKGHAEFKPVAGRDLVAGPGTLVAQYQIDEYPAIAAWQNVQLLYRPAIVLLVTWI